MPTTEEIEAAASRLGALLDSLSDGPWREPSKNHLDAVLTWARLGMDAQDAPEVTATGTTSDAAVTASGSITLLGALAPSGEPESTEH